MKIQFHPRRWFWLSLVLPALVIGLDFKYEDDVPVIRNSSSYQVQLQDGSTAAVNVSMLEECPEKCHSGHMKKNKICHSAKYTVFDVVALLAPDSGVLNITWAAAMYSGFDFLVCIDYVEAAYPHFRNVSCFMYTVTTLQPVSQETAPLPLHLDVIKYSGASYVSMDFYCMDKSRGRNRVCKCMDRSGGGYRFDIEPLKQRYWAERLCTCRNATVQVDFELPRDGNDAMVKVSVDNEDIQGIAVTIVDNSTGMATFTSDISGSIPIQLIREFDAAAFAPGKFYCAIVTITCLNETAFPDSACSSQVEHKRCHPFKTLPSATDSANKSPIPQNLRFLPPVIVFVVLAAALVVGIVLFVKRKKLSCSYEAPESSSPHNNELYSVEGPGHGEPMQTSANSYTALYWPLDSPYMSKAVDSLTRYLENFDVEIVVPDKSHLNRENSWESTQYLVFLTTEFCQHIAEYEDLLNRNVHCDLNSTYLPCILLNNLRESVVSTSDIEAPCLGIYKNVQVIAVGRNIDLDLRRFYDLLGNEFEVICESFNFSQPDSITEEDQLLLVQRLTRTNTNDINSGNQSLWDQFSDAITRYFSFLRHENELLYINDT